MGLSRIRLIAYASLAITGGAVAVIRFGVPLGTMLVFGVVLICPLMMMGMHGGAQPQNGQAPSSPTPDQSRQSGG